MDLTITFVLDEEDTGKVLVSHAVPISVSAGTQEDREELFGEAVEVSFNKVVKDYGLDALENYLQSRGIVYRIDESAGDESQMFLIEDEPRVRIAQADYHTVRIIDA